MATPWLRKTVENPVATSGWAFTVIHLIGFSSSSEILAATKQLEHEPVHGWVVTQRSTDLSWGYWDLVIAGDAVHRSCLDRCRSIKQYLFSWEKLNLWKSYVHFSQYPRNPTSRTSSRRSVLHGPKDATVHGRNASNVTAQRSPSWPRESHGRNE